MHLKSYQIDGRMPRSGAVTFSASGLERQDNDLIVIESAGAAEAFRRNFEARFASGATLSPGMGRWKAADGTIDRAASWLSMFQCFLFFCFMGGPAPAIVPDGAGGFVPYTNSRVMPDGSLRPYDPAIDGPYPGEPMAGFAVPSDRDLADPRSRGGFEQPESRTWIRPYPVPYQ
jgi:hypothetical protein